jgi:arsenate reductase
VQHDGRRLSAPIDSIDEVDTMGEPPRPLRVLFLCTHNSARSQMAEGVLRTMAGGRFDVSSAGTERRSVHPLAIRVMAERGIDISGQRSKLLMGMMQEPWDYVITVCDDANERCPVFPGTVGRIHWSLPDPSRAAGTEEERLAVFRQVRDTIHARLEEWLAAPLNPGVSSSRPHHSSAVQGAA